jgi:hypothetical protein
MWVFLGLTLGACALIVVWAIGYAADVGAVVGLTLLGIGILIQMVDDGGRKADADTDR